MEQDHVTDNLPAKLFHIRTFEKMNVEELKDLNSIANYNMCKFKMEKNPIWYPLPWYPLHLVPLTFGAPYVFVKFLYKVSLHFLMLMYFSSYVLSFVYIPFCLYERELSNVADTATRLYREATPILLDLLLEFRILWQKPKIDSSKVFDLKIL